MLIYVNMYRFIIALLYFCKADINSLIYAQR